jgi:hypothetical protein
MNLFIVYVECDLLELEDLFELGYQFGLGDKVDVAIRTETPLDIVSMAIAEYLADDITQFYQPRPLTIDYLRRVMMERYRLNKKRRELSGPLSAME